MAANQTSHPARFWHLDDKDGKVVCTLCPRFCRLGVTDEGGQTAFCYVRKREGDRLVTLAYGRSTGFAVDPVEKKPLNHFLPGTPILSFGGAGCNLGCKFCQNWDISKARLTDRASSEVTPDDVVDLAVREGCPSIAMTYNDPVIFAEFAIDVARVAKARGVRPVLVTAGYVTDEARPALYADVAAANVDLKAFTEDFYHRVTFSHLAPVLETLAWIKRSTSVWLEVTNLLIPGLNDSPAETARLVEWVGRELGDETPLHFSGFHPDFKMSDIPATPRETLRRARQIARDAGLKYVYTGNVSDPDGQTTYCPKCQYAVIKRDGYVVDPAGLKDGGCARCGAKIAGVFDVQRASRGGRRHLGLL